MILVMTRPPVKISLAVTSVYVRRDTLQEVEAVKVVKVVKVVTTVKVNTCIQLCVHIYDKVNPPRMCGRVIVVALAVCVSVKSDLTSGVSVHPEISVTYSTNFWGFQKICGIFSETAPLQRSSTPSIESHTYSRPFSYGKRTCAL